MAFDNVRFPTAISRGSSGGPERRTDVVTTASGREERNARWANSRRKYNAGYDPIRRERIERLKKLKLIDPSWQPAPTVGV